MRTLIVLLDILEEQNNFKLKVNISIFIVLGKFSGQGAKGLMTSDADRSAIVDKAARAAGAKMISYHITRGIYDFCVIAEGEDEETVIAMKGTVMMSGDFDQIDILSSVDVNKVRDKVKAILGAYTAPSKS